MKYLNLCSLLIHSLVRLRVSLWELQREQVQIRSRRKKNRKKSLKKTKKIAIILKEEKRNDFRRI
jgi:hypothetical protein